MWLYFVLYYIQISSCIWAITISFSCSIYSMNTLVQGLIYMSGHFDFIHLLWTFTLHQKIPMCALHVTIKHLTNHDPQHTAPTWPHNLICSPSPVYSKRFLTCTATRTNSHDSLPPELQVSLCQLYYKPMHFFLSEKEIEHLNGNTAFKTQSLTGSTIIVE